MNSIKSDSIKQVDNSKFPKTERSMRQKVIGKMSEDILSRTKSEYQK